MTDQIYKLSDVTTGQGSLMVEFKDGLEGELSFEDLEVSSPIESIDPEHLNSTDGREVKVIYENGKEEVFPWDYFRYEIDTEYRNQQKKTKDKELENLGKRVRRFRKARGLNQEDVANRAGIGRTTLSRLENGKQYPRFKTLMSIASALDIPFQKLMVEENTDFNKTAFA